MRNNVIKRTIITTRDPRVARNILRARSDARSYETRKGVFMIVLPGARNRGATRRAALDVRTQAYEARRIARKYAERMATRWEADYCVSLADDVQ